MGRYFTKEEDAYLRGHYWDTPWEEILANLPGRNIESIWMHCSRLGIRRIPHTIKKGEQKSPETQFKKGMVPVNKGKRQEEFMSQEGIERSKAGRFKAGHMPGNTQYDHCIKLRGVGKKENRYLFIRTAKAKWEFYHRWIWKQTNGEIPRGMMVGFKDGDIMNCEIENLELRTMAENMRRNSIVNFKLKYPDVGTRDRLGIFRPLSGAALKEFERGMERYLTRQKTASWFGYTYIVLTIAHLDHDHRNWEVKDERLMAMCQGCHLGYDAARHARKRKYGMECDGKQQMKIEF